MDNVLFVFLGNLVNDITDQTSKLVPFPFCIFPLYNKQLILVSLYFTQAEIHPVFVFRLLAV